MDCQKGHKTLYLLDPVGSIHASVTKFYSIEKEDVVGVIPPLIAQLKPQAYLFGALLFKSFISEQGTVIILESY